MSEHLVICLVDICIVIFEKYVSELMVHFEIGLLFLCHWIQVGPWVWLSFSYTLNTSCLYRNTPILSQPFLLSHYLSLVYKNEDLGAHDFGVLAKALFSSPRLCKLAWGALVWEITYHHVCFRQHTAMSLPSYKKWCVQSVALFGYNTHYWLIVQGSSCWQVPSPYLPKRVLNHWLGSPWTCTLSLVEVLYPFKTFLDRLHYRLNS